MPKKKRNPRKRKSGQPLFPRKKKLPVITLPDGSRVERTPQIGWLDLHFKRLPDFAFRSLSPFELKKMEAEELVDRLGTLKGGFYAAGKRARQPPFDQFLFRLRNGLKPCVPPLFSKEKAGLPAGERVILVFPKSLDEIGHLPSNVFEQVKGIPLKGTHSVSIINLPAEEIERLRQEFQEKARQEGLYAEYFAPDNFQSAVLNLLTETFIKELKKHSRR